MSGSHDRRNRCTDTQRARASRRAVLAALGAGTAGAIAGCTAGYAPEQAANETGTSTTGSDGSTPAGTPTDATGPTDVELPVPRERLRRAAPRDAIPAITEPAFATDWSDVAIEMPPPGETYRPRLDPDETVIGVERDGEARAYPLLVLDWHEVVNDEFGGPLLVTYCPLCRSGLVARRVVGGEATTFGVSGLLWRENLVLYDAATGSLWSQLLGRAIRGPATGARLAVLPSTLTTWGAWRERRPDTRVLLPPPRSNTVRGRVRINHSFDLVGRWRRLDEHTDGAAASAYGDTRLPKRELVLGVATDGAARAYPMSELWHDDVVNDRVGDLPVVVALVGDDREKTMVAYSRRVAGGVRRFRAAGEDHLRAGDSRWRRATGRAVDGPHEGTTLARANDAPPLFWFAWLAFHPRTTVYGRE